MQIIIIKRGSVAHRYLLVVCLNTSSICLGVLKLVRGQNEITNNINYQRFRSNISTFFSEVKLSRQIAQSIQLHVL